MKSAYFHSVTLEDSKCVGCTDCIKRCPTEAIRVRKGKAEITNERCIDCGLCIDVCRHHAKKVTADSLKIINDYKYRVAIPSPTLYAQFNEVHDVNRILTAIKRLGFDDVFELSRAAEEVSSITKEYMQKDNIKKPVISSACPTITRLIAIRFPPLIDNIIPIISPMEAAAMAARNAAIEKGIDENDIGIFFISPCAAKVTNARKPLEVRNSAISGVISMQDIYIKLKIMIKSLKPIEIEPLCQSQGAGISYAACGGEKSMLGIDNAISVDRVENVMKVLELVENGQLDDVDFIEGLACTGGCLGGALTITNSFVAKNNLIRVAKDISLYSKEQKVDVDKYYNNLNYFRQINIIPDNVLNLDSDLTVAIKKLSDITELYKQMPQIDCGSCGAPTCMALAEDIVQGNAMVEDCIFMLRAKVKELAKDMVNLSEKLPPSISQKRY